ncbi:hypothetical protein V6V47_16370 [Micromonospora sp. CPCC 205539]|uniref:hypothetical protein n=1 Tax=Micromonospora sp. CPCC 205539 TaxID=3122408 RepID=UPI002FF0F314
MDEEHRYPIRRGAVALTRLGWAVLGGILVTGVVVAIVLIASVSLAAGGIALGATGVAAALTVGFGQQTIRGPVRRGP